MTDTQKELDTIRGNWETFKRLASTAGVNYEAFQVCNRSLGWNLAKAVPALIHQIEQNEAIIAHQHRTIDDLLEGKATDQTKLAKLTAENKALANRVEELSKARNEVPEVVPARNPVQPRLRGRELN